MDGFASQRAKDKAEKIKRFQRLGAEASGRVKLLSHRIDGVVFARLAVFIFFLFVAWIATRKDSEILWGISGVLFIIFLFLIRYHQALILHRKTEREIIWLNEGEIKSLNGDFSHFENGPEYADPRHPYVNDLDIFGVGSLFRFLNRTITLSGKKRLAGILKSTGTDKKDILLTQEAVKELSGKSRLWCCWMRS
ncbi:MAG: hypothetical protein GXO83_01505 [Chlorobi bacterium]|nr:hypothetical protein [Chlorobiota bacterium]